MQSKFVLITLTVGWALRRGPVRRVRPRYQGRLVPVVTRYGRPGLVFGHTEDEHGLAEPIYGVCGPASFGPYITAMIGLYFAI